MAKLAPLDFIAKWHARFATNTTFNIEEVDFQEFATDVADSFGVSVVNVPEYAPGTTYTKTYLVRYTPANAPEAFYYSLKAGVLAAPGGNFTDWKVVPGPVKETDLAQALTLVQAQGLDQTSVKAGRTYLIDFGVDAQGATQTITVRGVANDFFDVAGTLEVNGQRWAVEHIDVQAGTFSICYTNEDIDQQLATVATTLAIALTRTAAYTLQLSDAGCLVPVASTSPVTVTVPDNASVPFPIGTTLYISQDNAGTVLIAAASGVVVQTADGYKTPGQWQDVALHKRDLNTWVLKGGVS